VLGAGAAGCAGGVLAVAGGEPAGCGVAAACASTFAVKLNATLQANVPVQFPFYYSSVRSDAPGDLAVDAKASTEEEEGDLEELPPLLTVLRSGLKL